MRVLLIEPHYLPSIEFFSALLAAKKIIFEKHEHFIKQSYRNRCYINSSQGSLKMVVPVVHQKENKIPFCEIRIDHSKNWSHHHWQSIQSSYGKAPFFEYYADELKQTLFQKEEKLYVLNIQLLSLCLKWLDVELDYSESVSYKKDVDTTILDYRSHISPKIPYSGRSLYKEVSYHQVFGNKFASNLSFLDLIFCEGPRSLSIIKGSQKGELNN